MKAAVLVKLGSPKAAFDVREVDMPKFQADEVLIKVEGFGLNYADVMARNGLYKEAPPLPSILGYEVVGRVEDVGSSSDSSLIGKRVAAFTRFGGYAEYAVTKASAVAVIPEDMDLTKATALVTQYVTAYYASQRCVNLQSGQKVLIHAAAGGVGLALGQLARISHCEVMGLTSSPEKADFLKSIGVDHTVVTSKDDYFYQVKKWIGSYGLDVSFNSVAGPTFKKDFKLLGSGGKLALYGAASRSGGKWGLLSTLNMVRQMGVVIPIGLMMTSKSVIGVNMLSIGDDRPKVLTECLKAVVSLYVDKRIDPVSDSLYSIDEIGKAHARLESRKSIGKIAVSW